MVNDLIDILLLVILIKDNLMIFLISNYHLNLNDSYFDLNNFNDNYFKN